MNKLTRVDKLPASDDENCLGALTEEYVATLVVDEDVVLDSEVDVDVVVLIWEAVIINVSVPPAAAVPFPLAPGGEPPIVPVGAVPLPLSGIVMLPETVVLPPGPLAPTPPIDSDSLTPPSAVYAAAMLTV